MYTREEVERIIECGIQFLDKNFGQSLQSISEAWQLECVAREALSNANKEMMAESRRQAEKARLEREGNIDSSSHADENYCRDHDSWDH